MAGSLDVTLVSAPPHHENLVVQGKVLNVVEASEVLFPALKPEVLMVVLKPQILISVLEREVLGNEVVAYVVWNTRSDQMGQTCQHFDLLSPQQSQK